MTVYDSARRRKTVRKGRERGVWLFVPAEVLEAANIDVKADPPWCRLFSNVRQRVIVQFYDEP